MPTSKNTQAASSRGSGLVGRVLEMPNETPQKMLLVTVALCFVCALLVSGTAVTLRPLQEANRALERQRNILQAAGLLEEGKSVQELFQVVESKVVDLDTGQYVEDVDPAAYDQRAAAKDPDRSVAVSPELDIADIRRRAKNASVYLVRREDKIRFVILPVHGYGLWSTLYGFIALRGDGNTVAGLSFYEHAETPGLGGEVDNPSWRGQWEGKRVYDDEGKVGLRVAKGKIDKSQPGSEFKVDGLAGATLTARGVSNLVQYWLGENGFGPYLARVRRQGA